MSEASFDYSNLSGRPTTRAVRLAGTVLRGIRRVQDDVAPYAAAWEASNRRALATDGPLWVAIGDSLTQGIGASAWDAGWVHQALPQLPGRLDGVRIVNLAFNGARVADVLERQLPAMESLGLTPDLVTVLVGNNDLVSRRWRPRLDATMNQILARLPTGAVVANQPGSSSAVRSFNRVVDAGVAEHGLVLAECRDPRMRSWRGKVAADHFHPNDKGYAAIAAIMAEALARG